MLTHLRVARNWIERLIRRHRPHDDQGRYPAEDQPLRSELYGLEQLEQHARSLAESHRPASLFRSDNLIARLNENERVLVDAYNRVARASDRKRRNFPAAEWLLDNFYLIEEQIRIARDHLPRSFSRELPRLANASRTPDLRVYVIARELISHVDGHIDSSGVDTFITAYQSLTPLKIGELWAVPIMLRLGLIENLRRVATRVVNSRIDRDLAADWAERMVEIVDLSPTDLILVMADMVRTNPPLSGAFLSEMTRHLQGQNPHVALVSNWLSQRLLEHGSTVDQMVQAHGQAQASDQISMVNSIISLRFLRFTDWRDFVEKHSLVEAILREDRAYPDMNFATRDGYRHAVESLARMGPLTEQDVARTAIQLTRFASSHTDSVESDDRRTHVGYYLIDEGRPRLEQKLRTRRSIRARAFRMLATLRLPAYFLGILLFTGLVTLGFLPSSFLIHSATIPTAFLSLAIGFCSLHLGIGIVNWLAILLVPPRHLPRMDFRKGIPAECRTMVVVPTMLSTPEGILELIDGLELRFLANRADNLHFALLTDLLDAPREVMPGDEDLERIARQGIEGLNARYQDLRTDIFFLFHRPRSWNKREKIWMGYERKRGKLAQLNAFLREHGSTPPAPARDRESSSFTEIIGQTAELRGVRYIITLDTDTRLPADSARRMVGAMAHPLNRPVFDPHSGRVVAGYGILQPRVGVSLPSSRKSWFVRLFAGDVGVDPYTTVVSDLYQDLFDEGTFIGKGIYDLEVFDQTCGDLPENKILSHDLLESTLARSAVLSDVELFEDFPATYMADLERRHRWIRGDWQIAPWLLPWSETLSGHWSRNSIGPLSRWKIFDNLRRSLVPVAAVALLAMSWLLLDPAPAFRVGLVVLAVLGTTHMLAVLNELFCKPEDLPLSSHLAVTSGTLCRHFAQFLCTISFLPTEARNSSHAILTSLTRMLWTKVDMLEWKTSSESARLATTDLTGHLRSMSAGPVLAVTMVSTLWLVDPGMLPVAGPYLAFWLFSPLAAWRLSLLRIAPPAQLSEGQLEFLRKLARRTWRYFEVFVTEQDNWLPPDNYQERLEAGVASRTSPTNIGIALLSYLSAYDFGYASVGTMIDRQTRMFDSLARMQRHRGHLYNWYDTRSLEPLFPLYVSTVDSGNLIGHLLVLRSGLLEVQSDPILPARAFHGLRDTARVLLDVARDCAVKGMASGSPPSTPASIRKLERLIDELEVRPEGLSASSGLLRRLVDESSRLASEFGPAGEVAWWAGALSRSCKDHSDDLDHLASWIVNLPPPAGVRLIPGVLESLEVLDRIPSLRDLASRLESAISFLDDCPEDGSDEDVVWIQQFKQSLRTSCRRASERMRDLDLIQSHCTEFAEADFSFLFDRSRNLFTVGYNVSDHRLDDSFYDLLASESRLTSYLAIAQGQLNQAHWFSLGRMLTSTGGASTLLSWSGSMFEYLMPLLVMPSYQATLLDQTYKAVVQRQINYGRQRGVPWGISESGFNAIDGSKNYQYRAFGVPGLGLKRGLSEDLVIAPYASALALLVAPEAACANLERLVKEGHCGDYGMYEAIDYTTGRTPLKVEGINIRQYMAHHSGMSLLSLASLLLEKPMQRRFSSDIMLRSADPLLHERVPKAVFPTYPHVTEASMTRDISTQDGGEMRVITDPSASTPEVHLLSNGRYHVMITAAGGGYSRWRDLAVTRWREDVTRDCHGTFCYVRDLDSGAYWSTAWQPTRMACDGYQAIFTQSRAEFRRIDHEIETHTQISVSPEDDIELRQITLTNRSSLPRRIELTSYAEVVLAPPADDRAHPAFSNLFVQSELVRDRSAILCTRRPRSAEENTPWMMNMMTVKGMGATEVSFETDRMKFIGRGRDLSAPVRMVETTPLSDSEGPVLDPVVCIRRIVTIPPQETTHVHLVSGMAPTRDGAMALVNRYTDVGLADRVFEMSWTHSQVLLSQLDASAADAQAYARLAGSIIYASAFHRAKVSKLLKNRQGQSSLWGYGISGDLPIMLVRIRDHIQIDLVRKALQAHSCWRMKGVLVDLVVWNEDDSGYRQTLQDAITDLVASGPESGMVDKAGGIFVRKSEQMSDEDRTLMQAAARVILTDRGGTMLDQIERAGIPGRVQPSLKPSRHWIRPKTTRLPDRELAFFNGTGGFSPDGREYVMLLQPGMTTPAPWVNVIANPGFGTVVSESGCAYTWAENSHEFRLTPWYNDPVSDTSGEAVYLRDEETGHFWSPSPLPVRSLDPFVARHGFGYSMFEHREEGIFTELSIYVAMDAPVKFVRLKIGNTSDRTRKLTITGFWELVLGELRDKTHMHVVTSLDPECGAIFARNAFNSTFPDRVVFVDSSESDRTITGDRTEFLGRNGSPACPAAMGRSRLSGRLGAGLDPCAAMQVSFSLEAGQEKEIIFTLGAAASVSEARRLVKRFRGRTVAYQALQAVWEYWSATLGVVHVETPDPTIDFLANGWLIYQTLACRMWARTGFYQSGGAFGFRDQLQDAMALVHAAPALLRGHLLRSAGRQFREGDVQHWWHPPQGRGVRTRFSDDLLWLPYATCRYVNSTGDTGVLDEPIPFLRDRALHTDEEAHYDLPHVSDDVGTLYEHCVRAIDKGFHLGEHGLPLMGCGDWNDGMNLVGQGGKGESVWLAFFLHDVLLKFTELARKRGDLDAADRFTLQAGRLRGNIEEHAWDGKWYRRAFFDDGTPLGSSINEECQIDAIAQTWSVLSGAGTNGRMAQAMESLDQRLVNRDERLIQLLDPPFDDCSLEPGYIKGYLPGVRENGGQYTHAAIWAVMAFAALGDLKRAWELFAMINPVTHSLSPEDVSVYRVEPFVVAADVYAVPPHTGRGGWTWYTGSAGWMYRLITESLLGLRSDGVSLRFEPLIPPDWKSFKIHYRHHSTHYHITLHRGKLTTQRVLLDGIEQTDGSVRLIDDHIDHLVDVECPPFHPMITKVDPDLPPRTASPRS